MPISAILTTTITKTKRKY